MKDRIAKRMIEEAEKEGILIPGKSVVIEPTSGNTGIGLALTCAVKGYKVVIVMPEKMSKEKEITLLALGAEVVRTPTEAASQSEESNLGVAKRLQKLIPHGVILDQYANPHNPLAHELGTAVEIIKDIESCPSTPKRPSSMRPDVFIGGAGTGGTVTGVSRGLKTVNKNCIIVATDPVGSIMAEPPELNTEGEGSPYVVEGIGYDFIPDVLSREPGTVDYWLKTSDAETFDATHDLIKTEGLLVGGSSGSALAGALRWLKSAQGWEACGGVEGRNAVVMLPDGIRNYMSKEWFNKLVQHEPTELAKTITKLLKEGTTANY